jgi:hypothetical protein
VAGFCEHGKELLDSVKGRTEDASLTESLFIYLAPFNIYSRLVFALHHVFVFSEQVENKF